MNLGGLAAAAENLLGLFATELTALGVEVPEAQYVGSGLIPWDGESLTIYLGDIGQGQPGAPFSGTPQPAAVTVLRCTIWVQLCREHPSLYDAGARLMLPDPPALDTAGQTSVLDAASLMQAAMAIHATYSATGPGEGFAILGVQPLGPEGGLAAMRLGLDMSLA